MKTRILNLIIILTLISGVCFGQNQISVNFNIDYLNGTWKNITKFGNENLTYIKLSRVEKNDTGFILKFKSDGRMTSQFLSKLGSRKCGNDIRHIPKTGNWKYEKKNNILKTNRKNTKTEYQILELTSEKLTMKRIINE